MKVLSARFGFGLLLCAAMVMGGCDGESETSGGDADDGSGGSAASGGMPTGGAAGTSAGGSGGSGGIGPLTCLPGVAGIWVARNFPAYLEIDSACRVNLFCDVENDYHTTGYVDGDRLVLLEVAEKTITVVGDVLTVLDAEAGIDLPFDRRTTPDAIPAECRL